MNLTATFAKGYAKIRKVFWAGMAYARKGAKSQSLSSSLFLPLSSIYQSILLKKTQPLSLLISHHQLKITAANQNCNAQIVLLFSIDTTVIQINEKPYDLKPYDLLVIENPE
ncbi:hypothetical protein [Flavobacterium lipolyticum]|uniref:Uncharacterized protein n=1 Tax=Flavobacterium lipolyticum TaxID=2893754 RepID=A0ABS8M527_9FLAO|nr:hypothetical protein [Flavobacterium sp. F-126]MCC9019427.1 hypothetical protein [Flavobacterium sp. F-126]